MDSDEDVQDYCQRCHDALKDMVNELAKRSPLETDTDTASAVSAAVRGLFLSTELTLLDFPDETFQAAGEELSKRIDEALDALYAKYVGGPNAAEAT